MLAHVLACLPEEACGLLAGERDEVRRVIPVPNVLHSPVRYQMEPRSQVEAMLAIEAAGLDIVGIYHSHPRGPAGPSASDVAEAAYPEALYLIWYPTEMGWEVRAFELREAGARPAVLLVEEETP